MRRMNFINPLHLESGCSGSVHSIAQRNAINFKLICSNDMNLNIVQTRSLVNIVNCWYVRCFAAAAVACSICLTRRFLCRVQCEPINYTIQWAMLPGCCAAYGCSGCVCTHEKQMFASAINNAVWILCANIVV